MNKYTPYVGVDLDATIAYHERGQFTPIGEPIPLAVAKVKALIASGMEVRIVSARCVTIDEAGNPSMDLVQKANIEAWCEKHLGVKCKVQYWKCTSMVELWDDRAIQFVPNTGQAIVDNIAPIIQAAVKLVQVAFRLGAAPLELILALANSLGIEQPNKEAEDKRRIVPATSIPKIKK